MTQDVHDQVALYISRTRYPFPGQQDWPEGYYAICNTLEPRRGIETPDGGIYYPDIIIVSPEDVVREVGEVEMTLDPSKIEMLRLGSETADDRTPTKVRHFFLYVPMGLEAEAKAMLEEAGISYAGVRGFEQTEAGFRIVPYHTAGDPYDH